MMTKSLRIVPNKCTGCMQCELACSVGYRPATFQPSRSVMRVNVFDEEASYAPYTCLQCDEAWCMTACPVNAIAIDGRPVARRWSSSRSASAATLCTIACPFGTVFTLPGTDKAAKCNLCGGQPACATSCPTDAIEYVEAEEAGGWFADWGDKVQTRHVEAAAAGGAN